MANAARAGLDANLAACRIYLVVAELGEPAGGHRTCEIGK
jgi:hypothetical protein